MSPKADICWRWGNVSNWPAKNSHLGMLSFTASDSHISWPPNQQRGSAVEVFVVFLLLGLTSFGGPIVHLAYFRQEFVSRREWLEERAYAVLVALCQFLPGPARSQVGMAIGLSRSGYGGALAAWTAFTLPSALVFVLVAYGVSATGAVAANA